MNFGPFFIFLNKLKTMHWLTKSYAHHKILDEAHEGVDTLKTEFALNKINRKFDY